MDNAKSETLSADQWIDEGNKFYSQINYTEAILCFRKAIELDEKSALPWGGLGTVYQVLKVYDEAIRCYQKAIELDEKFDFSWGGLGNVYQDLKNFDEAIRCYLKAIELDGEFAYHWNGLGAVYQVLKDYDEAIRCYQKAIELDEKFAPPWNGLGIVYRELRDFQMATKCHLRSYFLGLKDLTSYVLLLRENHISAPAFISNLFINSDLKNVHSFSTLIVDQVPIWNKLEVYLSFQEKEQFPQFFRVLFNYFCGDPINAFELTEQLEESSQSLFQNHYYRIRAYSELAEENGIDNYIAPIFEWAEEMKSQTVDRSLNGVKERFYAAWILLIDQEDEEALETIRPIYGLFLLAATMGWVLGDEDTRSHLKNFVNKGFDPLPKPYYLQCDASDIKVIEKQVQWLEIVELVGARWGDFIKVIERPEWLYSPPLPLWEAFQLNDEQHTHLLYRNQTRHWERAVEQIRDSLSEASQLAIDQFLQERSIELKSVFDSLFRNHELNSSIEGAIGMHIQEFKFLRSDFELLVYHALILNRILTKEAYFLLIYIALQEQLKSKSVLSPQGALENTVKRALGTGSLYLLDQVLGLTIDAGLGLYIGIFLSTYSSDAVKKVISTVFSTDTAKGLSYLDYRKSFETFIKDEVQLHGPDVFREKYKLPLLDELLKQLELE